MESTEQHPAAMNPERAFVEEYLSAYVDGASLEPGIRERLERLLQKPEYAQLYAHERAVRQLLRDRCGRLRYTHPPELLHSVRRAVAPPQWVRFRRRLLPAALTALASLAALWYFLAPPSTPPPCFMTALLTSLDDLQHGQLPLEPLHDTAAIRAFLVQQGLSTSFVFPYIEEDASLVGIALRPLDRYRLPVLVYKTDVGWLLLAEAPEEDFQRGRLWLEPSIWQTVLHDAWYWGCPEQSHTCAVWKTHTMVCGLVTTLPLQQVKQLLDLE